MARLCRFHMTGLGMAVARFNPLTIDLRDPSSGNAQDSVLWLRNGGGKTTLISLLYSTLIPDKRYFLGKLLGKDSSVADFVRDNDLGVIITEWEFPGQFGASRRVVGQAIKCINGEPTRRFFSFASVDGHGFDNVPVLGLKATRPAKTLDELLERLRKAADEAAGKLDLVIPLDQKEWRDHLENIGLDQELFEAHLKMNKQEGGAAELFKLKSADDFLRLFLDLIVDEESTAEEEKSLEALRAKVIQTPDREAAVNFGKEILIGLEGFANEAKALTDKRREEQQVAVAKGQACKSIQERITRWKAEQLKETELQGAAARRKEDQAKRRQNLGRYANGYRRRAQVLRVNETEVALEDATKARGEAQRLADIAEAAIPWAKAARDLAEKKTHEASLAAAQEEHRTEFEEVLKLGGKAAGAWESRAVATQSRANQLKSTATSAKEERERLEAQRLELNAKVVKAEAQHVEAEGRLEERRTARERLRTNGTLESDEKPEDGKQRWEATQNEVKAKRTRTREDLATTRQQLGETQTALRQAGTNRTAKANELDRIRDQKQHGEEEHSSIGQLQCVLDLCAGKPGDARSQTLRQSLEHQSELTHTKLVRHQIETLEDTRTEKYLAQHGLAAPSQDLELVMEWLTNEGIRSALPAYQWLAEHCSRDEAQDRLAENPGKWGGVFIQIETEWEALKDKRLQLPIKSPVMISMAGASQEQRIVMPAQTVVPTGGAMFNKAAAEEVRAGVQERRIAQIRKEEELSEALASANEAISRIKEFNRKWPQTWWEELLRKEQTTEEARKNYESEEKDLGLKEKGMVSHIEGLIQMDGDLANSESNTKLHLGQLATFLLEHEAKAQQWLDLYTLSQSVAEQGKREAGELHNRIEMLKTGEETSQNEASKAEIQAAKYAMRKAQLPEGYIGKCPSNPDAIEPENAETTFRAAIASYEGKIHKSELTGKIAQLETSWKEKLEEVELRRGQATDEEIALAAQANDLEGARVTALRQLQTAIANESKAQAEHQAAKNDSPRPRAHGEGSDINEAEFGPKNTSKECAALVSELEQMIGEAKVQEEAAENERATAEATAKKLGHGIEIYELMEQQLEGQLPGEKGHPDFSDYDDSNKKLITKLCKRAKTVLEEINRHTQAMQGIFTEKIQRALHNKPYEDRKIEFRERLLRLGLDDLEAAPDEHVNAVKTQVAVAENQLASLNEEKALVVEQMEHLAARARYWCEQASKVSMMSNKMGAWANSSFLEIHIARRPDAAERRGLLTRRVDEWFNKEANIPKGSELAFQCLQALGGGRPPTIKILKPQFEKDTVQHEITMLAKFSDGERLTTAILLYCVLVRLRGRHRGKDAGNWGKDAGMLLLDNPFGKATLAELVNLQVQTAREMGVQLVYATGINDFAALKHFGHIVRLRNSSRSRSTGDFHVTADDRPIEAAVVGHRLSAT